MNQLKSILLVAAILGIGSSIFAQRPGPQRGQERGPQGPNLEMLQKALDLSEDQVTALKPIFENTRAEMEALRNQEFDDREDRRAAAKAIMEGQKEKVEAILSAEQIAKMAELKEKRQERGPRGPRGPKANGEKSKALHKALKAYHVENIQPVMLAQRTKLEAKLSTEDKATIAELRAKRAAHKAEIKEAKGEGQGPQKPSEAQRAERKADRETIKALVTKYDADIESLLAEVKPQAEQWKEDTKAIFEEYKPERTGEEEKIGKADGQNQRRGGQGAQRGPKGKERGTKVVPQGMKKGHFLMFDPNGSTAERSLEESPFELQAYPNPASGLTTINYTVEKDGQVQIMLNNKTGTMSRILLNTFQKAGTYNLEINTSDLQGGNYFYTINDASGSKPTTKQLIIKQ